MFKQISKNIWSIEPPPFPNELEASSKTVIELAKTGFVYQGFDGNFHYFIRRQFERFGKPCTNRTRYEELLVYGAKKSILVGYSDSFFRSGECEFHRYSYGAVKKGAGFLLFEEQLREKEKLPKPTGMCHAMAIDAKRKHIEKKFACIKSFFEIADESDFQK